MRAGILIALLAVAQLGAGACQTYKHDPGGLPGWPDGATFEAPPSHMVTGDGPIGGGSTTDGGGGGGTVLGPPTDARPTPDAAVDGPYRPEAGGGDDGGPRLDAFAGTDSPTRDGPACTPCSLVRQDCPMLAQGCYPNGAGGGCCAIAGGSGPGADCLESTECDRGSFCAGGGGPTFCRELCDPSVALCRTGRCAPLPGYAGAGYCIP